MFLRVLGPVEVRTGESWCVIGAPKWRALLAALLLHRGRVVPVEGLIDELWPGRPPAGARKLVSGYVARLRGVIGDPEGRVLVTRAPGYVLLASPADVDAGRFEELLAAGRSAWHERDVDQAATTLIEALALWRGQAFADVPRGPAVTAEADRLEELRLTATELWYEAGLASGKTGELVPGLRQLVTDHPLNERFWLLLMRALVSAGRQAEALEAYGRAREMLANELGVDPGLDLQHLYQRILAKDQPSSAGSPAVTAAPRQLPPGVRHFVGRSAELARLTAVLDEMLESGGGTAIATISGTAGVGKTALAVHWSHLVADRFPDGQLYVNLKGFAPSGKPLGPSAAIRGFLDALETPAEQIPVSLDSQIALYRSLLSDRRMLVLLDNARTSDQVLPLLSGGPGCLVLVTSRNKLTGLVAAHDAYPVNLDVLSADEARELLRHRLGPDLLADNPAATDELIELCAHLPLALSVLAAEVTARPARPLSSIVTDLRDSRARLDTLSGDQATINVRAVFSWSYRQLKESGATMLRLLSLHPGPDISVPAAASLAGIPRRQARADLANLAAASLITEVSPDRYAFHDLLRAYAAEQCAAIDSQAERRAAASRVFDYYLHAASGAARTLFSQRSMLAWLDVAPPVPGVIREEHDDYDRALAWLRAERHVLIAVISWAATESDPHAMQIPLVLRTFLHRSGHWHDCLRIVKIALAAAGRLGDLAGQAHAHRLLSTTYNFLGSYQQAERHATQALALYEELGYPMGQGDAHLEIAHMFNQLGRPADTLRHAERALEQFKIAGYRAGEAISLNNVGWCHILLGNFEQALPYLRQALDLQAELDDQHGCASTWDSIGGAYFGLGQYEVAIDCYRNADKLAQQFSDRYQKSVFLHHLGNAHQALGDLPSASDAWSQALIILEDLEHPDVSEVRAKLAAAVGRADNLPAESGSESPRRSRRPARPRSATPQATRSRARCQSSGPCRRSPERRTPRNRKRLGRHRPPGPSRTSGRRTCPSGQPRPARCPRRRCVAGTSRSS
jgi:DNA-binding SARP family transcriptional activator